MKFKNRVGACGNHLLVVTEAIMLFVLTGCGVGNFTTTQVATNLPVASTVKNTVPVTVGANAAGTPNAILTSVKVCTPGVWPVGQNPISGPPTQQCQNIDNILVDTGSVGLRLLSPGTIPMPVVTDSNEHPLFECAEFADFSYVWGPVVRGTVQMAGETAAQVPLESETPNTGIPIQIIVTPGDLLFGYLWGLVALPPVPTDCLSSPPSGALPMAANTLETLGANGILGVGTFLQDCGATCASSTPPNQYYYCPASVCSAASVPQDLQLWDPVAAFAYDNNGLLLALPTSPPSTGSGTIKGSLIFGIETQADNALGEASIYPVDAYGNFPQVTLNYTPTTAVLPTVYVNYVSPQNGSYIDSGSPAIYFSDSNSLGPTIPDCTDYPGLYCPAVPEYPSVTVYGTDKTHGPVTFNVMSADSLLSSGNSVFSNLGGDSGIDPATDYVDLGVPFFLGINVFVGFAGTELLNVDQQVINYPNGYWAIPY